MSFETRLSQYLAEILCNLKEKILTVQSGFSLVLFSLFAGFLFGNLFGTFLDMLSLYFVWNGFVGIFLILLIEVVNSLIYGASLPVFWEKLNGNKTGDTSLDDVSCLFRWFGFARKASTDPGYKVSESKRNPEGAHMMHDSSSSEQLLSTTVGETRYQEYTSRKLLKLQRRTRVKKMRLLHPNVFNCERGLNSFKIGLLFGFFVDSFKVGS